MSRFNTIVVTDPITNVIEVITPGPPGSGASFNGGVFITDITPQSAGENVGSKTMSADGESLISCVSTTSDIVVHVLAITGHSSYKPVVQVNETSVSLTETSNKSIFTGSVSITIGADGLITATHSDGPTWESTVETDTPPVINAAVFYGSYPGVQTELKENDTFTVRVTADIPFTNWQIADYGALKYQSGSTSATFFEATGVIANRGTTAQALGFRVRVQSPTGAWSTWFDSTSAGVTDGLHKVTLNNLRPSISFGAITYPPSQQALKGSEQATVAVTASNYDTISFTSSQLSIVNPTTYAATKTVTRTSGDYNLANNLTAQVNRIANNSIATAQIAVQIANVAPTLSVSTPATRLRSGGNAGTSAQNHTVTVTASQHLLAAPTLAAPHGMLSGFWSGSGTTWHTSLQVHDNDTKGVHSWSSIAATNLAGIPISTISSGATYTLGGFAFRTLTVPAFPTRQVAIGTIVSDTAKLRCTNLSKGPTGSLNFTYQATTDEAVNKYTILTSDTWYNCDGLNASSNTTGTMQIELEEVV